MALRFRGVTLMRETRWRLPWSQVALPGAVALALSLAGPDPVAAQTRLADAAAASAPAQEPALTLERLESLGVRVSPTAAGIAREAGLAYVALTPEIVRSSADGRSVTVLANGLVRLGNSGDETSVTLLDPGLFRLDLTEAGWTFVEAIPLERNRIRAQDLAVTLVPGTGLSVQARLEVRVTDETGLALGLNHKARLQDVRVGAGTARHLFRNGLLWIDAPQGDQVIHLAYDLEVDAVSGANSGAFQTDHGHARNQFWWHPSVGLTAENGLADFNVSVTAPAVVEVSVDLPAESMIVGSERVLRATSPEPVTALSLAYDATWQPRRLELGAFTLDVMAASDFVPDDRSLEAAFDLAIRGLVDRFGLPPARSLSIVQNRARDRDAWAFLSNTAIHAGPAGAPFVQTGEFPVHAPFGHEVAHLWTRGEGELRYFLTESWATYAESVLLEAAHGPELARQFWRDRTRLLEAQPDLLDTALAADRANTGISYHKGAWVLAMLERAIGRDAFDAGIRSLVAAPAGQRDLQGFIAGFGPAAGDAGRFLTPWLTRPGAPDIVVERDGDNLVLVQRGATYWLPQFGLEITGPDGQTRRTIIELREERTPLPLAAPPGSTLRLDPDERYLLLHDRQREAPRGPAPSGQAGDGHGEDEAGEGNRGQLVVAAGAAA